MKLSIRANLIWFFSSTIFIILLLFSLILYWNFQKNLVQTIDTSLLTTCKTIEKIVFNFTEMNSNNEHDKKSSEHNEITEISYSKKLIEAVDEILAPNGYKAQFLLLSENNPQIIVKSNFPGIFPHDSHVIETAKKHQYFFNEFDISETNQIRLINYLFKPSVSESYLFQLGLAMDAANKTLKNTRILLLLFIPIILIIVSFVGRLFVKKAFTPINSIVQKVNNITVKDLSLRIEDFQSKDEIGELVNTFNQMISRLETSFNQIKQFSSDVSHELKTPLTVLKGEIEVLKLSSRSIQEYENALPSLLEEVEKLQNMINNLLMISNLETQKQDKNYDLVNLNECILEAFDTVYKLAEIRNQKVEISDLPFCQIRGDRELLIRLFRNLLENAVKYTPEKGEIKLRLLEENTQIIIEVSDNGNGIETEHLGRIFDRFYRVDKSRNWGKGGSGLGLAIVQNIVQLHRAEITVESTPGSGSIFKVTFPKQ